MGSNGVSYHCYLNPHIEIERELLEGRRRRRRRREWLQDWFLCNQGSSLTKALLGFLHTLLFLLLQSLTSMVLLWTSQSRYACLYPLLIVITTSIDWWQVLVLSQIFSLSVLLNSFFVYYSLMHIVLYYLLITVYFFVLREILSNEEEWHGFALTCFMMLYRGRNHRVSVKLCFSLLFFDTLFWCACVVFIYRSLDFFNCVLYLDWWKAYKWINYVVFYQVVTL